MAIGGNARGGLSKIELGSWFAVFSLPLIPTIEAGVSLLELVSLVSVLASAVLLLIGPTPRVGTPTTVYLLPIFLLLSLGRLTHEETLYFLSSSAGTAAFVLSVWAAATAPQHVRRLMPYWLFAFFFSAASIDILLDLLGWSQDKGFSQQEWTMGSRGLLTSRSPNGSYLVPLALWAVAKDHSRLIRVIGLTGLVLAFYHVVVLGQGRGTTILALLGLAATLMGRRGMSGVSLVVVVCGAVILSSGYLDPLLEPLLERAQSESLEEVDRLEHARSAIRLVLQMDVQEMIFGIWNTKIRIANGGGIHNAYLNVLTSHGLIAWTFLMLFFIVLGTQTLKSFLWKPRDDCDSVARVVVVQLLVGMLSSAQFVNWRFCVAPAICCGLALSYVGYRRT